MSSFSFEELANLFIEFFNCREFSKLKEEQLFNDVNSDIWWMSGDESVYPFSGSKSIKKRMENFFPLVTGFDEWSFKATDIIISKENKKIIIESVVKGIGFGDKLYTNNYLFILFINDNGKINLIREYLDNNSVVQYTSNNIHITNILNKLK